MKYLYYAFCLVCLRTLLVEEATPEYFLRRERACHPGNADQGNEESRSTNSQSGQQNQKVYKENLSVKESRHSLLIIKKSNLKIQNKKNQNLELKIKKFKIRRFKELFQTSNFKN